MADFGKRPQPYRVQYPITPSQVENIDQMFEILFKRLGQIQLIAQQATTSPAIAAALSSLMAMEKEDSDPALLIPGPTGPQGPQGIPGVPIGFLVDSTGGEPDSTGTPIYSPPEIANVALVNNSGAGTLNVPDQTVTAITFNSEIADPNGMHSTSSNTSRVTAQVDGKYLVTGGFKYSAQAGSAPTGLILIAVGKNGTIIDGSRNYYPSITSFATDGQGQNVAIMVNLARNDYVELLAYQAQGGAGATLTIDLDLSAMQVVWVSQ